MKKETIKYSSIFCLEGEWNQKDLRDKTSVSYLLNYMEESLDISSIFRKVNSKDSFYKYLALLEKYWKGKFNSYGILYLAFHGESNCIWLDDNEKITLEELSTEAKDILKDRIIHFGSCSTLKIQKEELTQFFKNSGAKAVSGFSKEIPFLESSVFDIAYLSKLSEYEQTGRILNFIHSNLSGLSEKLGFIYIDKN